MTGKSSVRSWVRADDTARLDGQAGQMDMAVACRDACGAESFAAVLRMIFSPRSNRKFSKGLLPVRVHE
jgi:hypothetical protein